MWNTVTILILAVEIMLLIFFVIGRIQKRRLHETALFLGVVFAVNFFLHMIPFLYDSASGGEANNVILGILDSFTSSIKLFVGETNVDAIAGFTEAVPLFNYAYLLGTAMSVLATVSTAIEAFRNTVRNSFRLSKACKKESCDIVVGNSAKAVQYAKACGAVFLLDDSVSKEAADELMEAGYAVLRKGFTADLFKSRRFNTATRYNVICTNNERALEYIETFTAYKKSSATEKNIYLYVELAEDRTETIRREIIEKSGLSAFIDTFCTDELLARTFAEENPVTRYLPKECIEEAAVKPNTQINVFMLGFSKLGRELYRQLVLNNQLVTFDDGQYKLLPIHYYICDIGVDRSAWNISGLEEALSELDKTQCFPMPELPFQTEVIDKLPTSREVMTRIRAQVQNDSAYNAIIIATDDGCCNIEIGAKLRTLLLGQENYHIFVRSESSFVEDDALVTYFGRNESVFTHDVIVNAGLSAMAKKVNEVYTAQYAGEERNSPGFAQYVKKKAEEAWSGFDYFTLHSNHFLAMSLRVKLNLLGLDYVKDNKGENTERIGQRYPRCDEYAYSAYFEQSVRNALIAQEHARWNAYHLLSEYLPLEKSGITVKPGEGKKVRFNVKNTAAKKHACLTTHQGLNALSSYLAEKAGGDATAADYDYYIYDEMLITSAEELLRSLSYSVTEK